MRQKEEVEVRINHGIKLSIVNYASEFEDNIQDMEYAKTIHLWHVLY